MSYNFTSRVNRVRPPRGCYAYNEWLVDMGDKVISCVEYFHNDEPVGVIETTIVNDEVVNEEWVAYDPTFTF